MPQTCIICKTNAATVSAKIANKETGELSAPVPLCEACLNRVSKTRKVEIAEKYVTAPVPASEPPVQPEDQKNEEELPLYRSNIKEIAQLFEGVFILSIAAIVLGLIAALILVGQEMHGAAKICLFLSIGCIVPAFSSYILKLIFEAIDDYFDTHK